MTNHNGDTSRKTLWAKLAMAYYDDPKFTNVEPLAELLYVRGISFAKGENTGYLSRKSALRLASDLDDPAKLIDQLCEAGLWADGDEGGFVITNWQEWQEDAGKIEAKREKGLAALHRRHSAENPAAGCRLCQGAGWSPTRSPISNLLQERETEREIEIDALSPDGFDEFWVSYPRKTAKADAVKAWKQTAKKRPAMPVLLAALETAKAGWSDPRYVPYPASWLRGQRWEDHGVSEAPIRRLKPEVGRLIEVLAPLRSTGADEAEVAYACSGFSPEVVGVGLGWFRGGEIAPEGYEIVAG